MKPFTLCVRPTALLTTLVMALCWSSCTPEDLEAILDQGNPEIQAVSDAVASEMRLQQITGMAVGVIQDGKIAHLQGYGYQDLDGQIPVTNETVFRWASISKTLTTIVALRMWEQGDIDLDKDVRDYVPSFPDKNQTITLRQLLQNRGDIPAYSDVTGWADSATSNYPSNRQWDPIAALNVFEDAPLRGNGPGNQYYYSTFGFMLAGAAIDAAARRAYGRGYLDLAQDVADSLGMESLRVTYNFDNFSEESLGYALNCGGALVHRDQSDDISWRLPGGAWQSNIRDLARLCRELMQHDYLDDTTYTLMQTPASNVNTRFSYAMGTEIVDPGTNIEKIGHGGVQNSARSQCYFYSNQNTGIVVLSNTENTSKERVLEVVAQALGIPDTPPTYNYEDVVDCDASDNNNDWCVDNPTDEVFAGIWQVGQTDQLVRRGYYTDEFNAEWNTLTDAGYVLTDVETSLGSDSRRRWDGIFTRQSGRSAMWRNFTTDDFNAKWQEMSASGLRLIDLEAYTTSAGELRWAGAFVEGSGRHALWRGFNFNDFKDKWDEMIADGQRLIDLETYEVNGTRFWAGVFREGSGQAALWRGFNTSDFGQKRLDMQAQGLRLEDVEAYYDNNGTLRWAGTWIQASDEEWLNRNVDYCGWLSKDMTWRGAGGSLVDLESY
jgi:CubicO group peptidase (beta-lactamase class C family)